MGQNKKCSYVGLARLEVFEKLHVEDKRMNNIYYLVGADANFHRCLPFLPSSAYRFSRLDVLFDVVMEVVNEHLRGER